MRLVTTSGVVFQLHRPFALMCGLRFNRPDQADPGIVDENVQPAEVSVSLRNGNTRYFI